MSASIGRAAPRVLALLLALGVALGLSVPVAATAKSKPVTPGVPRDLAIGTITVSSGAYVVPTSWVAAANDASYLATITAGGATLVSAHLTATSWSPHVSAKAGTVITLQVRGVAADGRKKSAVASTTAVLPDVTAPTGSFSATWPEPSAATLAVTFTKVALSDDATPEAQIKVVLDLGDDSPTITNPTFPYTYDYTVETGVAKRFQPTVELTDLAGNKTTVSLNGVVAFDDVAPTGSTAVAPAAGWAGWTGVTLRTTATDNLSPARFLKRRVDWGDGTSTVASGDRTLRHVYAAAGRYRPTVTLTDEALPANEAKVPAATSVLIRKDVYRPTASLSLPRAKRRSARSWKVLRGTATDAQTAVSSVRVKVVEKRGRAFYAYVPATHAWVKAGRRARALKAAGYLRVATTKAWSVRVPGLKKGTLVYRVEAVDAMGNVSAAVQHSQRLSRR